MVDSQVPSTGGRTCTIVGWEGGWSIPSNVAVPHSHQTWEEYPVLYTKNLRATKRRMRKANLSMNQD